MEARRPDHCNCAACRAGRECSAGLERITSPLGIGDPGRQVMGRALEVISSAVPCQALGWYPVTAKGEHAAGALIRLNRPVAVDAEQARREYVQRYHRDDPFAPRHVLDSPRPLLTMDDIGGTQGLMSTEYGRELLPECGVQWELAMYLRDGGLMLGAIRLSRTAQDGEFQTSEVAFLERTQSALELSYNSALRSHDA
jgi:hypothetical protein